MNERHHARAADRSPRVLLIAEQANPEWVSVPLEGWSHSIALARITDAHIVTQVRNREAFLRHGLVEGEQFTAIDSEAVAKAGWRVSKLLRGGSNKGWTLNTALSSLAYYYFESVLWKVLGRRIREREWDIVHRVTPLSPTAPSRLAAKCRKAGVPFVVGPLNGGLPWPKQFGTERRREKEWLSYVRGAHRLLPGYRAMRRHASALIYGSRATWEQGPREHEHKTIYIPENAIDPERFNLRIERPVERPIRIAFLGRLVPYKGADMLLRAAAALVRSGDVAIDVIGDGPEMPKLRAIVDEEGIASGVTLAGFVDHSALQARLVQSDLLGFPSVREFGGAVVLEAMVLQLVPLIVDYGGPAELVTEHTGFTVPLGSREEIIASLRERLEWIVAHPERIRPMGRRGRSRVLRQFTWDAKARQVFEVYEWVLGRRAEKPEFGMPLPELDEVPAEVTAQPG